MRSDFPFVLKSVERPSFTGMLHVFTGDICPGAFRKTLAESARSVPLLWDYDVAQQIGRVWLEDRKQSLLLRGCVDDSLAAGAKLLNVMERAARPRRIGIIYEVMKTTHRGGAVAVVELRLRAVSCGVWRGAPRIEEGERPSEIRQPVLASLSFCS